jgi:hypothetical protein
MGRILSIKLPDHYLPVLAVNAVEKRVQTTVLWGDTLLYSQTWLPENLYFTQLLQSWSNIPMTWGEFINVPISYRPPQDFILHNLPIEFTPVAEKTATLLSTGFDPIKRYWAEFAGNYNLYFGLFQGDWNKS